MSNDTKDKGYAGDFEGLNPDFSYKMPDLSTIPMLDNMDRIDELKRQQKIWWPEFSWQTIMGDNNSRCFQMLAHDISRIGYTDEGRIYSIICPQSGAFSKLIGSLNLEVTVTSQRGWVNENTHEIAADMTVTPKIWFSHEEGEEINSEVAELEAFLKKIGHPFPLSKEHAIVIEAHRVGNPEQPIFPLLKGETALSLFKNPDFARHIELHQEDHERNITEGAFGIAHLQAQIGRIRKTGYKDVDLFNQFIVNIFNLAKGNMLLKGNVLTWNLWLAEPEPVDVEEWRNHAEKWRKSLNVKHCSPEGEGTDPCYYDGKPFTVTKDFILQALSSDVHHIIHDILKENEDLVGAEQIAIIEQELMKKLKAQLALLSQKKQKTQKAKTKKGKKK